MMQVEDMKEAIVENEMEYVREIVFKQTIKDVTTSILFCKD